MSAKLPGIPTVEADRARRRARVTATASAALGFASVATLGLEGFLMFGPPGVELGGWFLPLGLAAAGASVAAVLLYLTAWGFAWSQQERLGGLLGGPLAWAAGIFGLLLPGLLFLVLGGLFLMHWLAGAGGP